MTNDEIKAWVDDPRRADTLPFGVYEPAYRKGITGAALVVRGVLYFRNGHTPAVRQALVKCFEEYRATIDEYTHALEVAAGQKPSKDVPLRWFYTEGEQPVTYDKAPGFANLAQSVPADVAMVATMTSADHKLATGFYEFAVFTIADWQSKLNRGLDALDFTVPRAFLLQRPGVFQALFTTFAEALPTVHGHAGLAVNLPPMEREANEASEYYLARRYGPGIDVGDPMAVGTVDLIGRIKTVDWMVALDTDLVRAAGGASSLSLPAGVVRAPAVRGWGFDHPSRCCAGIGHFRRTGQAARTSPRLRPAERRAALAHPRKNGHHPVRHPRQHRAASEHERCFRSMASAFRRAEGEHQRLLARTAHDPQGHEQQSRRRGKHQASAAGDGPSRCCRAERYGIRRQLARLIGLLRPAIRRIEASRNAQRARASAERRLGALLNVHHDTRALLLQLGRLIVCRFNGSSTALLFNKALKWIVGA